MGTKTLWDNFIPLENTLASINMLGFGNSKIIGQAKAYGFSVGTTFDLLAGWSCPAAKDCQTFVHKKKMKDGTIKTWETWGEHNQYSCYAADIEARYKNAYFLHKRNMDSSKESWFVDELSKQIKFSGTNFHRWHSSGDFYDYSYFKKILEVIKNLPEVKFYAYTKRATFMKKYIENPLKNFVMMYSFGGTEDKIAVDAKLPMAHVIIDPKYKYADFTDEGMPIACQPGRKYDDIEYIVRQETFGLYVH